MRESFYETGLPLSAALLTDLHGRDHAFLGQVRDFGPDLIAVAGDVFEGGQKGEGLSAERAAPFFAACVSIAPTFFSLGNHEWILHQRDLEKIRELGVCILDDSYTLYKGIAIGGLTSAAVHEARRFRREHNGELTSERLNALLRERGDSPDLSWLSDLEGFNGFRLLLCHQPEYYPLYLKGRGIDLVLSGHAHGGQIRFFDPALRFWRGLFAPGQGFFPALTGGLYDSRLLVSRGLSNTAWPIPRLFNPRELVLIRGRAAAGAKEQEPAAKGKRDV